MEEPKVKKEKQTEPQAAPDAHVTGEIAGGVLIASIIVSSVSLWAVGFVGLVAKLA